MAKRKENSNDRQTGSNPRSQCLENIRAIINSRLFKGLAYVCVIVAIFLILYQPPLFNINISNYLIIPVVPYLLFKYGSASSVLRGRASFLLLSLLSVLYLLCLTLVKSTNYIYAASDIYLLLEVIPIIIAIAIYFKENKKSATDIIKTLVIVGTIQGVISIVALTVPGFKSLILDIFSARGYDIFVTISTWRIFGFADGMTFAMPMVQLIIGLFAMFLGIVKKSRYLVISFIILIPAFVNARITIFIFILLAPMVLIAGLRRKKYSISKIVKISILSIATGLMMILLILSIQSPVSRWLGESFQTTLKLVSGEKTATFVDLSKDMVFPSRADSIIFGEGIDLSHQQPGSKYQSDIGWIVNIWKGGLVYSCLVYASLIIIMIKICKLSSAYGLVFCLIVVPTLIIGNTKGIIAGNSPIIVLLLLVYYGIRVSNNAKAVIDEK